MSMRLNDKKIALITPNLTYGGFERVMLKLAKGFTFHGVETDFVTGEATGEFLSKVPENVSLYDMNCPRIRQSLRPITQYLNKHEPDVILSGLDHLNVVTIAAAYFSNSDTSAVIGIANIPSLKYRNATTIVDRIILPNLMKLTYPWAEEIIAVSRDSAADVARMCNLSPSEITVIPNPIYDSELVNLSREPVDHDWLTDSDSPVILGAGRLVEVKDFMTLIKAFDVLDKRNGERLIIVGEGPKREELEALVSSRGLEDQVSMPGYVDNPYSYMRRAEVFVLSSITEGFGNVLVEAMSTGTPVVSTRCSSGPETILQGGKFGGLCPPENPELMAEEIEKTLLSPPSQEALLQRAKCFSVNSISGEYLKTIFGG